MPSVDLTPFYQPQGSTSDGTKFDNLLASLQTTLNGLDNSNVANAANIAASKIAGIATVTGSLNVGSANTDLASPGGARVALYVATTGGGTVRSVSAPTENGSLLVFRNNSASSITLKHQLAGGAGAQLYIRGAADLALAAGELATFTYDGTNWVEVSRDQAGAGSQGTELDYVTNTTATTSITATTEGTAQVVLTGNSITYDGSRVKVEFFWPKITSNGISAQFVFLRDSSVLGQATSALSSSVNGGFFGAVFDTPSAGAHTYKIACFQAAPGTLNVLAGAGGSGNLVPAYQRVTKA